MKKLLLVIPLLVLTACAVTPSQKALKEVNQSKAKVAVLTAAQVKTAAELAKATKELKDNQKKFDEIYFKGK